MLHEEATLLLEHHQREDAEKSGIATVIPSSAFDVGRWG
jgi:hypothetical protein